MEAARRTALISLMQRYTKLKKNSKETALASLVHEGIYTAEGMISADYGGSPHRKTAPAKK